MIRLSRKLTYLFIPYCVKRTLRIFLSLFSKERMLVELPTKDEMEAFRTAIVNDIKKLLQEVVDSRKNNLFQTPGLTSKPVYKMKEVCALFGISRPTVYDWIREGKLKPRKIRARVYFLTEDINRLIEGRT